MLRELYYKLATPSLEIAGKITPLLVLKQLLNIAVWFINLAIFWFGLTLIMLFFGSMVYSLLEMNALW